MKRVLILTAIFLLVILNCSKDNITNNYYPSPEFGSIVGFVYPPEPDVKVIAYLGTVSASTYLDSVGYFELPDLSPGLYSLVVQAEEWVDFRGPRKVSLAGGSTVSMDTIFLTSIHDLIDYVVPFDGARHIRLDERIRIRFRRGMNTESVEGAFSLEPDVEGDFYWYLSGRPPSYYYSELQFTPRTLYASNTTYQVTVDTAASDDEGTRLSEPYRFSFTTEQIAVSYTIPLHRETWVSPTTGVSITFNTQMDIESVILAFKMVDSQLNDVTGEFFTSHATTISFVLDSPLAGGGTYTVTIDTNAKDLYGGSLPEPYIFWFTTRP
ncbi:MAG: Ig-like domain-containing protein [Candidatus Zixiibacteriota bacterium]|nr:MAG: Ig-like domain-containing protein [candidate division Zixibacteria bacterium]